jgi:hypothetical protein
VWHIFQLLQKVAEISATVDLTLLLEATDAIYNRKKPHYFLMT